MSYVNIRFEGILAKPVDLQGVHPFLLGGLRKFGEDMAAEFNKTTDNWSKHPTFKIHPHDKKDEISVDIDTDDPVWNAIDQGTPPRTIKVNPPRFAGIKLYAAGSLPGTLQTGKGFSTNIGVFWAEKDINWPGIEARKWSELLKQKAVEDYDLQGRLQEALNYAATKGIQ
jgi:hypothetical protein